MSWAAFLALVWVFSGVEAGLRDALQVGSLAVAPSFLMVLLVFVCLWSSPRAGLVGSLVVGVCQDLLHQYETTTGELAVVVGPYAIGALLGGSVVLNLRALMFRRNVWTIAFLACVASGVSATVATALVSARSAYDVIVFEAPAWRLAEALLSALYTGGVAIVVGPVLGMVRPFLGFPTSARRAFGTD